MLIQQQGKEPPARPVSWKGGAKFAYRDTTDGNPGGREFREVLSCPGE